MNYLPLNQSQIDCIKILCPSFNEEGIHFAGELGYVDESVMNEKAHSFAISWLDVLIDGEWVDSKNTLFELTPEQEHVVIQKLSKQYD